MAGYRRGRKGLAALGAIVALLLTGLVAVGLHSRSNGGTAQAAGEIYLAPAATTGSNPFTASLMTPAAPPPPTVAPVAEETPPIAPGAAGGPPAAGSGAGAANNPPPAAAVDASTNAAPTAVTSVDGSVPQLYGGRMGVNSCDEHLLVRYLDADGDVARAWADAEGIDVDTLHGFAGGLVSVDILDDVRVTDWHRVDGHGSAVQVVLQRGTTVLVDRYGVPRVRCLSGDPLTQPDQVRTDAKFVGPKWESFRPAALIVIAPANRELPTLVLLETSTGQPFGRRIDGEKADIDTQTLVADQDRLGVVVSLAPARSDAREDVRLSPAGGPPGSTVFAIGTGWPVGDRIRLEPCIGGRPETCSLRPELAVFTTVGPDGAFATAERSRTDIVLAAEGGFRGVRLTVPADVRDSDYVEFYVQDLNDGHHQVSFSAPWRVSARTCEDGCGDSPGCHPPFCGGGDSGDRHGCACLVRNDPVCSFDSCGNRCPKDACAQRFREEPTASPRGSTTSRGDQTSTGRGSGTREQLNRNGTTGGNGSGNGRTPTQSTTTTATASAAAGSTSTGQSSTRSRTSTQTSSQTTHAQTTQSQTSTQSTGHPTPPPHTAAPTSTPPPHTAAPTSTPPPHTAPPTSTPPPHSAPATTQPTAAPTPAHTAPPSHPAQPTQTTNQTATTTTTQGGGHNQSPPPGGGHQGGGSSPGPTGR